MGNNQDNKPKSIVPYFNIKDIPETTQLAERIIAPYSELNYCLNGLILNRITLLIAPTDSGKTCFSSSFLVSAIKQGYKCFMFAGEDGEDEARDRLYRQYLEFDKENFIYTPYMQNGKQTNCGEYLLKHDKFIEVSKVFDNNVYIYNNDIPSTKDGLLGVLERSWKETGWRFGLIDNCDMFELDAEKGGENNAMKNICKALRQFAISHKVHLLIVCHIKKTERGIIRFEIFDAKGSSSLTNISKNIISLLRTDCMDKGSKEYKNLKKVVELNGYNLDEADAVAEVLKTKGRKRKLIGLKFNRISNSYYEMKKIDDYSEKENSVLYANNNNNNNYSNGLEELDKEQQAKIDDIFGDNSKEDDGILPF